METALEPSVASTGAPMRGRRARREPRATPTGQDGAHRLANALGWFSVGLGLAQVVMPASVARLVGAEPTPATLRLMRGLGLRELSAGVGILSGKKTDKWLRARVAGDMMDLALLGKVLADDSSDRSNALGSTLAVAGVTALDMLAAARLTGERTGGRSQRRPLDTEAAARDDVRRIRRAITIARSPDEVAAFWKAHVPSDDALIEQVRFVAAPGGRGTEVHLERAYERPGPIARMIATLRHDDPAQYAFDELFALKQILETGDVVISDAWINGPHTPHPAQPE